jgi:hypothetical protein
MNVFYTDYYTQAAKENKFLFLLIWIKCILHFYQVSVALFSRIVKRECSNGISFINDTLPKALRQYSTSNMDST